MSGQSTSVSTINQQKLRIFVSGPYSRGDVAVNVRNAIVAADALLSLGYAPFLPHLFHFWHLVCPHDYETWLAFDNQFLPVCRALLRLPGESPGADREVQLAEALGIPVFRSVEQLHNWARSVS